MSTVQQVIVYGVVIVLFVWATWLLASEALFGANVVLRRSVDEVRDADVLTECEAETEVWEGYRFGPAAQRTEPTSELLFAAANQLDQVRNHLHFDHPREEYLSRLVPELRARAMSFVKQYD